MEKRTFLKLTGLVATGAVVAPTLSFCSNTSSSDSESNMSKTTALGAEFTLPTLSYGYADLEPHIDAMTMELHHSKHHAGYTKNLNAGILGNSRFEGKTIEQILGEVKPGAEDATVRNNGGGYYNHCLYWEILAPQAGGNPTGAVADSINKSFGNWEACREALTNAAGTVFGSGWAWLCVDSNKSLFVTSTANQDNPLMTGIVENKGIPIVGIDVWEHAYYLKNQNRRADYLKSFFDVLNWEGVNKRLLSA